MSAMIQITRRVAIAEDEIGESFVRASGPGGQHVNTTSSAVELRFDAAGSSNLPEDVRRRLLAQADRRITQNGVVVILAQGHRSQARNRAEALERLIDMIRAATVVQRVRRPTRPTLASKTRRLAAKSTRGAVKTLRRGPARDD